MQKRKILYIYFKKSPKTMQKLATIFGVLVLVSVVACKKKKVEPTVKDLLTSHIWIGKDTQLSVTAFGFPVLTDTLQTDSSAVEFRKDDVFVLYSRNPSSGSLTEITRQGYTLSPDNKTISLSENSNGLLSGTLQILADSFNVQLPRSIDIETITPDELVLKGQFQQNIRAGDLPFSMPVPLPPDTQIPVVSSYRLSFRK